MTSGRFPMFVAMLVATVACLASEQANAAGPVAVVEDVAASGVQLDLFDYLDEGQTIDLGATGVLVVGYLASCLREVINGGRVTIGAEQSEVVGGAVERELVECDGGNIRLTEKQAGKSGAQVFRNKGASESMPEVELRVFSLSPFLNLTRLGSRAGDELVIERLDRPTDPLTIRFENPLIDLAKAGVILKRGGLYRASAGTETIVFRVDRFAAEGPAPLLSRLIQF